MEVPRDHAEGKTAGDTIGSVVIDGKSEKTKGRDSTSIDTTWVAEWVEDVVKIYDTGVEDDSYSVSMVVTVLVLMEVKF